MILWTARSENDKTGNVPTGWVGGSRRSSLATCKAVGCPLLQKGTGGPMCYAQYGSPGFGHASVIDAKARGQRRTLLWALANRHKTARMVRIGAIGDPAGSLSLVGETLAAADVIRAAGLAVVGYTHGWRQRIAKPLCKILMASCDSLADVDLAISRGWRAAVVVPYDQQLPLITPGGNKVVLCPAMAAKQRGKRVTCNDCRLCDATKPGPTIAFTDHGATSPARRRRYAVGQ